MIKNMDPTQKQVYKQVGTFAAYNADDPGFVRTPDGGAWLYRVLPNDINVLAARDNEALDAAARPFESAFDGLSRTVNIVAGALRGAMKGMYRRVHVLAVATPTGFGLCRRRAGPGRAAGVFHLHLCTRGGRGTGGGIPAAPPGVHPCENLEV